MNRLTIPILIWLVVSFLTSSGQNKFPSYELNAKGGAEMVCLTFNPDGRLLASADQRGNIYVWDVESKSLINTISGKQNRILSMAFSPDGNFLAAANNNFNITVWSARHGVEVKTLLGHKEAITKIAFSPDSKVLASGSADHKVLIWNFTEGNILHTISDHTKEISALAFTLDGKLLATAGYDGLIFFWNTTTWKVEKKMTTPIGRIRSLAISPDNRFIAVGTEKRGTHIYEIYTGYLNRTLNDQKDITNDLLYSQDGRYLFTGSFDYGIKVVETEGGKVISTLTSFYHFNSLHLNSFGQWLAVADYESKIKIFDISSLKIKTGRNLLFTSAPLGGEIVIELLEPAVPFDSVYYPQSNKVMLRGKATAKNGISELRISNEVVPVSPTGFFEHEIRVPMERWYTPITARDFGNQVVTRQLVTQRSILASDEGTMRNGRDFALLIATDRYDELEPLNNPIFDATAIRNDLEELYGFEVKLLTNPTKNEILQEIRNYSKREYAKGDQLFIFIAGHGDYDNLTKQGYLAGRDSRENDEIKDTFIPHAVFREYVNNIPCSHVMLVLDVCFGGTINSMVASRAVVSQSGDDIDRDLFVVGKLKYTSRRLITSGGKEYVSDGIQGNHSPFARRFIEALRSKGGQDGVLTFNEIIPFVEKVEPGPTWGEFGKSEPGSDFLFIVKDWP
ncbi:MAG: caspase family protein [Cyclobacteriaceae bacterium]|jgi:hypothetical protein